ncbi:C40 family peptidase [Streptomyces chumphonensis]|uniref:C40 family peptidase n=1 Tax=Streptomyces chumphonensis TaxID=1214925 RepID=UPI003D74941D
MAKNLIVVGVLLLAFLFSGGGILVVGIGIVAGMAGSVNAFWDDDAQDEDTGPLPPGTVCDPGGESIAEYVPGYGYYVVTPEQMGHAATIVHVGEGKDVPEKGLVIAIMTALQESKLDNLDYGDRDSLGLFQQRPSMGWGSEAQVTDPAYAAGAFFGGPEPPTPPGLLDTAGWEQMAHGDAAQAVQLSGFPRAYDKWQSISGKIVGRAKDIECDGVGVGGDVGKVIQAARSQLGVQYCWGGGDANGPTYTPDCPRGVSEGFDCSGLTLYAYAQVGITLGHYTGLQWNAGKRVRTYEQLRPGDLMFYRHQGTDYIHHVSMYLGDDQMIHAPRTGSPVEIVSDVSESFYMDTFIGGSRLIEDGDDTAQASVRPGAATPGPTGDGAPVLADPAPWAAPRGARAVARARRPA